MKTLTPALVASRIAGVLLMAEGVPSLLRTIASHDERRLGPAAAVVEIAAVSVPVVLGALLFFMGSDSSIRVFSSGARDRPTVQYVAAALVALMGVRLLAGGATFVLGAFSTFLDRPPQLSSLGGPSYATGSVELHEIFSLGSALAHLTIGVVVLTSRDRIAAWITRPVGDAEGTSTTPVR